MFFPFQQETLSRSISIKYFGGSRVLVHYGGKSALRSGLIDRVEKSLKDAGLFYVKLGGVVPNPHLSKVREGITLGKENNIDFILAVGGGSVIDSAKAIGYGLAEQEYDVWELFAHTRKAKACMPVASVLTIAAAGSEMSNSCVITNEETAEKGIAAMEDFYHKIGMPATMTELGISPTEDQIRQMAQSCMEASGGGVGSARELLLDDMIEIYTMAL